MLERVSIGTGIVVAILIAILVVSLAVKGVKSRQGKPLGMQSGQLQRCATSPNCVVSEFYDDTKHYLDPIVLGDQQEQNAMETASQALVAMGGRVTAMNDAYIASEFKSSLFGFVDDFELRLDQDKHVLHFRSSSRVGYSDLGANAKRVQTFKSEFARRLIAAH